MHRNSEIPRKFSANLAHPVQIPEIPCPEHPQLRISRYFPEKCAFACEDCAKSPRFSGFSSVSLEIFLEKAGKTFAKVQSKVLSFFEEMHRIEEAQISLFSSCRQRFHEIFELYSKDAGHYFEKLKENTVKNLDFDAFLTAFAGVSKKEPLEFRDFEEKASFLRSFVENSENPGNSKQAIPLEESLAIFVEEARIFTQEMSIFLTDSLETLQKSYKSFSVSSLERILKQTKHRQRFSVDNSAISQWTHPQKSLEINGMTPFAKDLALLGAKNDEFFFCTCSNDEKIRAWKLNSQGNCETIDCLLGHCDWVNRMVFDEERNLLISSSRDHTIRVWDVEQWKCVNVLAGHQDSVYGLTLFSDSPIIASGSYDKTIRLWDIDTFSLKKCVNLDTSIYEIRAYDIKEVGPSLVAGDSQGSLHFFFVVEGISLKKRSTVKAHEGCILRLVYLKKDKLIASSANKDKYIKLWNSLTMTMSHQLAVHDERGVSGLFFAEKLGFLFTAGKDNVVKIIDGRDFEVVSEFKDSFIQSGGIAWVQEKNALLSYGGKKTGAAVQMTINIRYFK